jgi:hypothetical protein
MLRLPCLVSDDEVSLLRISPRCALVLCDSDDDGFTLRTMLPCPSSTFRPFVRLDPQACGHGQCPLGYRSGAKY